MCQFQRQHADLCHLSVTCVEAYCRRLRRQVISVIYHFRLALAAPCGLFPICSVLSCLHPVGYNTIQVYSSAPSRRRRCTERGRRRGKCLPKKRDRLWMKMNAFVLRKVAKRTNCWDVWLDAETAAAEAAADVTERRLWTRWKGKKELSPSVAFKRNIAYVYGGVDGFWRNSGMEPWQVGIPGRSFLVLFATNWFIRRADE